ncbi:hypothetical protein Q3G72_009687 [Acer saccharum]|nr:hypothetical protein Q3G72_009687 [Acer saccharum]
MGYGPPIPREIHHFYTLRKSRHGATYFLLSYAVENWIPEGARDPGQVEISDDDKKKGFIWGFSTSNKRWKNSWFFVSGAWGRDAPTLPVLLDDEISYLAAVVVLPLVERGQPFLLEEEKMISQRIFPRLIAKRHHLSDIDVVCDVQAQTVKNFATTSQRQAADCKSKEKVGASRASSDVPIFDANVPETPEDPASDLNPKVGRGKRPVESTPNHATLTEGVDSGVPAEMARVTDPILNSENVGEPNVSTFAPPDPTAPSTSVGEQNVATPADLPGLFASAMDPEDAREEPSATSAGTNKHPVLFPFQIFLRSRSCHMIHNDVYIRQGWEHVKNKSCNKKMEFFFHCHSLMMSEMADNYRLGNRVSAENKHPREQISRSVADKFTAEEKLSATEEEIRLLKEQLSTSLDSLAARMEMERLAEEAKEKAERESKDLSSAYYALLLREFERGMRQSKKFFAMKDHSIEMALKRFDKSLQLHMDSAVGSIKDQIKRSLTSTGNDPDLGPVSGRDYGSFMPTGDEEIAWPFEDEIDDEEDSGGAPLADA